MRLALSLLTILISSTALGDQANLSSSKVCKEHPDSSLCLSLSTNEKLEEVISEIDKAHTKLLSSSPPLPKEQIENLKAARDAWFIYAESLCSFKQQAGGMPNSATNIVCMYELASQYLAALKGTM